MPDADLDVVADQLTSAEFGAAGQRCMAVSVAVVVKEAVAAGARAVVDRSFEQVPGFECGYFVGPTLLADPVTSPAYQEELFGRVLVVMRVDTLDEAIALIRNHRYGNGRSIFTNNAAAVNSSSARDGRHAGGQRRDPRSPSPATRCRAGRTRFGDTGLNNTSWTFYTRAKYVTNRWESHAGTDFGFRPN